MSIVTAQGLAKHYGAQDVFGDIAFAIAHNDKIGLVGPNGAGKTTLLRVILGREEPSAGVVHTAKGLSLGYLPQKPVFASQQTLYNEMLDVFTALRAQQSALLALADEMASAHDPSELMARYASAEQHFELAGGYEYENRIRRVLSGLGFSNESLSWPIDILSGGQVTRALLAKLLLEEPDLLVLDEPTNYLDLEALEWLESYLLGWTKSLLIVSHDRYFLDKVVSRIWELNHGRLEAYRGSYGSYLVQREERIARRWREYREQQEYIERTEEYIRRNKAGQLSKQARGRETRLNRMERIEAPETEQEIRLRLLTRLRSGDNVLASDGLTIGFDREPGEDRPTCSGGSGNRILFETGGFLVQRGDRIALLGPNGAGKTTLLRTLLGEIPPLEGRLRLGASVRIGYLPQAQSWLDGDKTVLEQLLSVRTMQLEGARALMGRFLFGEEDVHKLISSLSGGERSRLGLAMLTLKGANLLVLDEPTTHLDLRSQEILQRVLQHFEGTILLVSHDRYLVDALATHIWAIRDGGMQQFEGTYTEYMQWSQRMDNQARKAEESKSQREEQRRRDRQEERAVRRAIERAEALEDEIARVECELATLSRRIEAASAAQDVDQVQALGHDYRKLESKLAERLSEWESAASLAPSGA